MRTIAILDTYYPQFLARLRRPEMPYEALLELTLNYSFGTADFYSRGLSRLGWNCFDIIANDTVLQAKWAEENNSKIFSHGIIAVSQITHFNPQIIFCQDLSLFSLEQLKEFKRRGHILAGQCSCALGDVEKVRCFDILFTSFPYYIAKFESIGVHGIYLPLAFDPVVLKRTGEQSEKTIPCCFVGGIGHQWDNTIHILDAIAQQIKGAQFWGYGYDHVPQLKAHWKGEAWGLDMYRLLRSSKIVINRHGAISRGCSNNLRLFEATGCGALVLTETSSNIEDFFEPDEIVTYRSAAEAVDKIRYYLDHDDERRTIAAKGQARTLKDHTYAQRMPRVSELLEARLIQDLMHHPV
jgi:hypothetical protein